MKVGEGYVKYETYASPENSKLYISFICSHLISIKISPFIKYIVLVGQT